MYRIFGVYLSIADIIAEVTDTRGLSISDVGLLLRSMKLNFSSSFVLSCCCGDCSCPWRIFLKASSGTTLKSPSENFIFCCSIKFIISVSDFLTVNVTLYFLYFRPSVMSSYFKIIFQCTVYMDGVMKDKDGTGKEESELPGGWERLEIAWPLVCR